jgi:hypothetical protein
MRVLKRLSVRAKFLILISLFAVGLLAQALLAYWSRTGLASELNSVGRVQLVAVRDMTLIDMMHDGIRATVYRARLAALEKAKSELAGAAEELGEMSGNMREYLAQMDALPLSSSIKSTIVTAKPEIERYIELAEQIIRAGSDGSTAAHASLVTAFSEQFEVLEEQLGKLGEQIEQEAEATVAAAESSVPRQNMLALSVSAVLMLFAIALSFLLGRSVTVPLSEVANRLKLQVTNVRASSSQIARQGQGIAERSTEQAASLEETAASLEEVSAQSKQNAENARMANKLSAEVEGKSAEGVEAMEVMSGSIQKMKEAGDETAEIIKSIEEIAFQTNLLALNAAVEAARAGEAGKGFAVVAEEVRNLAQRSTSAAKNTAEKLQRSKDLANESVNLSARVRAILSEIREQARKAASVVSEISTSVREQAVGIDQVNSAVRDLDKVTQLNSASAEEFAASGAALSEQSNYVGAAVHALEQVLYGGAAPLPERASRSTPAPTAIPEAPKHLRSDSDFLSLN